MTETTLLRNCWYLAGMSREFKAGELVDRPMLGDPVVIGRDAEGKVFALRNICPHRGIPLSHGWMEGCELRCCYHGWKFDTRNGSCTEIPSMTEEQAKHIGKIRVRNYAVAEQQGNVWIFMPEEGKQPETLPPVPTIPDFAADAMPNIDINMQLAVNMDHTVIGLMDPTHVAYVHTSWWWHGKKAKRRESLKDYEAAPPQGFRMARYPLKGKSAKPYRILGDNVSTEITFQLPGVRIEHIKGDRHTVVAFTALTPINASETRIYQSLYWSVPWLSILKPIVKRMMLTFLGQDRDVMIKQAQGLAYNPQLMLINDADAQARWYLQLKKEYEDSQREGRAFNNPVRGRKLHYHS